MERWTKYFIREGDGSVVHIDQPNTFEAHASLMGGYAEDRSYESRELFWNTYFRERYIVWDSFIRARVSLDARILSVASGRGINEMRLLADGYRVTCSDLCVPQCHRSNSNLFGAHEYLPLDILRQAPPRTFDAVFCLSLIYLFDAEALDKFFRHVSDALEEGGVFILDGAGSEQSLLGSLYHRGFLKWEAWAHYLLRKVASATPLSKFRYSLIIQQHGYRWKSRELIGVAKRHGLVLVSREDQDPWTDLSRSPFLLKFIANPDGMLTRFLLKTVGNRLKHLRLFEFKKKRSGCSQA